MRHLPRADAAVPGRAEPPREAGHALRTPGTRGPLPIALTVWPVPLAGGARRTSRRGGGALRSRERSMAGPWTPGTTLWRRLGRSWTRPSTTSKGGLSSERACRCDRRTTNSGQQIPRGQPAGGRCHRRRGGAGGRAPAEAGGVGARPDSGCYHCGMLRRAPQPRRRGSELSPPSRPPRRSAVPIGLMNSYPSAVGLTWWASHRRCARRGLCGSIRRGADLTARHAPGWPGPPDGASRGKAQAAIALRPPASLTAVSRVSCERERETGTP